MKTKIKVGFRNGINATVKEMMAYFDPTKNEYTWIDENNNIHSNKDPYGPKERIQLMTLDERNHFYELVIDEENDVEGRKKKIRALIEWFKKWPKLAHAVSSDSINSFPTEVHKLTFAREYANNSQDVVSVSSQPYVLFDESEIKKVKSANLTKRRKTLVYLETVKKGIEDGVVLIDQVMFMCGLNPIGLDIDEKEQHLHDWIESNQKHEYFADICEKKTYSDPALFAVNAAVSLYIITKTDTGYYHFEGSPISKEITEVALYFRTNKDKWVLLRNELKERKVSYIAETPDYVKKDKASKMKPSATTTVEDAYTA